MKEPSEADRLLSTLAHDLRSPLTGIRGAASLLVDVGDGLAPAKRSELLRLIERESGRMADRIEILLVANRLAAGQPVPLFPEAFDLAGLLADQLPTLSGRAGRQVKVSAPAAGVAVQADRDRVGLILRELMDNAARYAAGEDSLRVRAAAPPGAPVWVDVEDRGPGIPEADRTRIFERGLRLAEQGPGAGLGLYAARGLALAMGGEMSGQPRRGGGLTIRLQLPAAK